MKGTVKTVRNITLKLSHEEAVALMRVSQLVGGKPTGTRGIFTDKPGSLQSVLKGLGIEDELGSGATTGSIYFED